MGRGYDSLGRAFQAILEWTIQKHLSFEADMYQHPHPLDARLNRRDSGVTTFSSKHSDANVNQTLARFRVERPFSAQETAFISYHDADLNLPLHSKDENDKEDIQWEIDNISVENVVTLLGKVLLDESDEYFA